MGKKEIVGYVVGLTDGSIVGATIQALAPARLDCPDGQSEQEIAVFEPVYFPARHVKQVDCPWEGW